MNRNARSDDLHLAVQAFARGESARSFDDLALDIADFQRQFSPGFARLTSTRRSLDRADEIPGVPCDAFRLTRVAVHPAPEDRQRFYTSGTTSGARGMHPLRVVETYRVLSLELGQRALLTGHEAPRVLALAPLPDDPPTSSLGYMMTLFMNAFDAGSVPAERDSDRFLLDEQGVNVARLQRAVASARERGKSILLLATSFALAALLDALGGRELVFPRASVVMQTGGFKGKSREIPAADLRAKIARAFSIPEPQIVSEYGMTELTSQLYDATLPGSSWQREGRGAPGVYRAPPWLRVVPVDPLTLKPVADGDIGLARIVDLGNVDSAVAVQTQDLVRRVKAFDQGAPVGGDVSRERDASEGQSGAGIELLGRASGAVARGCALAVEEFLNGARAVNELEKSEA